MSQVPNANISSPNPAKALVGTVTYDLFGPSTAAALGGGILTLPDQVAGSIRFKIAGLTSETINVKIAQADGNYSAALYPIVFTTGLRIATASAGEMGNGSYILPLLEFGSPKYVKFTKSSTSETAAVAIAVPTHSNFF
jgi:hypothetical protein